MTNSTNGQGHYHPAYPIAALQESLWNPRVHYDAKGLVDLGVSLAQGQLTPVLGRPTGKTVRVQGTEIPILELAAGHRRLRAARQAKLPTLAAIERPMTDPELLEVLTIENLQREDVHPLEEARGYQSLLELGEGYDIDAIAAKVGKSLSYLYQRLKLLALTPASQQAFLEGQFTAGHAIHLARLQPDDQKEALKEFAERNYLGQPSVREFGRWIHRAMLCELSVAPFKLSDADLVPSAGACTNCPKRTGAQPGLFPELDDGLPVRSSRKTAPDRCMDRRCHEAKMVAHLVRRRAELSQDGKPILEISTDWSHAKPKPGKPIPAGQWFEVPKKNPNGRPALVVTGYDRGQVKHVTLDRPKVALPDNQYAREQTARAAKAKRLTERHRRLMAGIRASRPAGALALVELQMIGRSYLEEMHHETRKELCRILELTPVRVKRYGAEGDDLDQTIRQYLEQLTLAEWPLLLLTFALAPGVHASPSYGSGKTPPALEGTARRCGVDLKAIDRALAPAKPKKKARQQKATPKPKKQAGDVRRAKARRAKVSR